MKVIGLIGGITWQSTIMYYEVLNRLAIEDESPISSARCLIHSVEFGEISRLQVQGKWAELDVIMSDAAVSLERGGAKMIIICANTMHLCIDAMRRAVTIPIIHIAEVTSEAIVERKLSKVALLGTKYTMEKPFFRDVLRNNGIDSIIPNDHEREEIHRIIYEELAFGKLLSSSKETYKKIIERLKLEGAQGVILGCTEIPLLIKDEDVSIPTFDTTTLHATAAFNKSMEHQAQVVV